MDAFDTRGPRFDSSHRQNFIEHLFIINCIEKTKINKKEAGNGPLLKNTDQHNIYKRAAYYMIIKIVYLRAAVVTRLMQLKQEIRGSNPVCIYSQLF